MPAKLTSLPGGASPAETGGAPAPRGGAPALRVVAGRPTAEELAAVVVVLAERAARAGSQQRAATRPSAWSAPSRLMRASVTAAPGAWRASALPR